LKNLIVRRYDASFADKWNAFIGSARNATFLFDRGYMDYHSDRFEDFSLILEENGEWIGVLPANREGEQVVTHGGLTYGGLVYKDGMKLAGVIDMLAAVLRFLESQGVSSLRWKCIPSIYHAKPSQEAEYALFLTGATLVRRDTLSVLDLSLTPRFSTDRKAGQKRGEKTFLHVKRVLDPTVFWNELLVPSLNERHDARPVHTADEMRLLMERFPEHIHLYTAFDGDRPVAGTVLYLSDYVIHSQYIAADAERHKNGSLDFLHVHLLSQFKGTKRWFDFGISNEADGQKLNGGLSYWKESFGCGTVTHDFYEVATAHHARLQNVLL
jgi:hypothetical protein